MFDRVPISRATHSIAVAALLVSASVLCANGLFAEEASLANATTGGGDARGISAAVLPSEARPGDVVELRIVMSRESWGRFDVREIGHPNVRTVARVVAPVAYQDQKYTQRYSLFLQPVCSGKIELGPVPVDLTTADGQQTVDLTMLDLNVIPFGGPALSDAPLALPPGETESESSSMFSQLFWGGVACSVLGIWTFVFFGMRRQNARSQSAGLSPDDISHGETVQRLRAGVVPKDELSKLLQNSSVTISDHLRNKIEQAVYSSQVQVSELAALAELLQEELRS